MKSSAGREYKYNTYYDNYLYMYIHTVLLIRERIGEKMKRT